MAYNKITLNGETKIDLTQDTVTAEDVALGKTFHLKSGEIATGTYTTKLQEKTVTPTTSRQSVTADGGYDGLDKVNIEAVVPSNYYKPEEIANVTPTTNAQVITPTANSVFNQVNVSAVTSAIDQNIKAENIKKDVTILGVAGTLEEGGGELAGYNVESIVSEDGASQTLTITSGFSANGNPIEVATDEEMTNALTQANVGKVYKFTGTSSTYETDAIYIVSEVE